MSQAKDALSHASVVLLKQSNNLMIIFIFPCFFMKKNTIGSLHRRLSFRVISIVGSFRGWSQWSFHSQDGLNSCLTLFLWVVSVVVLFSGQS